MTPPDLDACLLAAAGLVVGAILRHNVPEMCAILSSAFLRGIHREKKKPPRPKRKPKMTSRRKRK